MQTLTFMLQQLALIDAKQWLLFGLPPTSQYLSPPFNPRMQGARGDERWLDTGRTSRTRR